jgi:hypothetical protein
VAATLKSLYHHGFPKRTGAYQIRRETIRELLDITRVESSALRSVDKFLREDGYFLRPVDRADYGTAKDWIVDRVSRIEKSVPTADDEALARLADREARKRRA